MKLEAKFPTEIEAVHFEGKIVVGKDDVGPLLAVRKLQRRRPVRSGDDAVPIFLQGQRQEFEYIRVIVDDKDAAGAIDAIRLGCPRRLGKIRCGRGECQRYVDSKDRALA